MGFWLWIGSLAAVAALSWWLKRRGEGVDDYFDREYQDPPSFDAGGFLGGGGGI